MIKAVLFDLDGTLLDRHTSLVRFVKNQYDRLLADHTQIDLDAYCHRFLELDAHGHVWKDRVYQQLQDEFDLGNLTWEQLLHDYETQFMHACVAFPHAITTLKWLQQQGYVLGLISNGHTEFQNRSIDALQIRHDFDTILISETEGIKKPNPQIFHRALKRLGTAAEASVYIGDNPIADIEGAQAAGMWAVWKRDTHWPVPCSPDGILDDWRELPDVIQQIR